MGSGTEIAIFIPSFGDGGVERMLVNLARGFAARTRQVDFLVRSNVGGYLSLLPPQVRLLTLGTRDEKGDLRFLIDYLRREAPDILLSAKRCDREALRARKTVGGKTRVFLRTGTTVSRRVKGRSFLKRWSSFRWMRRYYPQADGLIAVSEGVALDVHRITGIPLERISVIPNPTVTPEIEDLARAPVDHPWLQGNGPPVLLGVGGLRLAKDFPTLLRAFAQVRRQRPVRLIILGKGRQLPKLQKLAVELGVAEDVSFPGFAANPYAFMARADLFVLSSAWEGFPNVLAEAAAVGTPVVSTDCESGPRELLQNGKYGPLVPVGNPIALARAILDVLEEPLLPESLQEAAARYQMQASCDQYLKVFGLAGGG